MLKKNLIDKRKMPKNLYYRLTVSVRDFELLILPVKSTR